MWTNSGCEPRVTNAAWPTNGGLCVLDRLDVNIYPYTIRRGVNDDGQK